MDTSTGKIYDSKEEALKAGVSEDNLITGTNKALRKVKKLIRLSQKARTRIHHHRKRKLAAQKESRKRNR